MKSVVALTAVFALMSGSAFATGDVAVGKSKYSALCASCHGINGGGVGIFPKLTGLSADTVTDMLKKYRAGERVGPNTSMMAPFAAKLSDNDITNLAAYIATLKR